MGMIADVDKTLVTLAVPVSSSTASADTTAVDVSSYEGVALVCVSYATASGGSPTFNAHLEAGAASNGSDAANINNVLGVAAAITQATATGAQTIAINLAEIGKYLRVHVDIGGSATFVYSIVMLATKKYA